MRHSFSVSVCWFDGAVKSIDDLIKISNLLVGLIDQLSILYGSISTVKDREISGTQEKCLKE